ncbi:toxin [Streptomyces sp. NRRL F-4489]|nr:toxin [Streptomyces sp. NRRL F-4489]
MNDCVEVVWTKSSYSNSNEDHDCVEVGWTKSSYSNSNERDDCVEVAPTPTTIHIRDSKDVDGPHLHVRPAAWADFVAFARA